MRPVPRWLLTVASVAVLVVAFAGCGSSSSASKGSTASTSSSAAPVITIKNFEFSDATAKVGQTVRVENKDSTDHTVTADDGSFDTGPVHGGGTATFTVSKAGDIAYHCAIHNYMHGVIHVRA